MCDEGIPVWEIMNNPMAIIKIINSDNIHILKNDPSLNEYYRLYSSIAHQQIQVKY